MAMVLLVVDAEVNTVQPKTVLFPNQEYKTVHFF